MSISIEPAKDAESLARIHAQCFTDEVWTAQAIEGLLATPGTFALVARGEVGFILVRAASDESEILTICVLPAARRRGIATALINVASLRAQEGGATVMFLEVSSGNNSAIAVYKQLGFAEVGRRKGYYSVAHGMREDALVLRANFPLIRVCNCLQLG